jgi:hypothetical protein
MPAPKNIKILPELADYLDPLDAETFEQLKAQIARDGLTDPICYATITLPGGTVDAIIDGHHRYRACKEVGTTIRWRLIESVRTIEEAKAWMFQRQDGRRNWSPNRRAMYVAEAYEAAKVESGRRTDLHGGAKIDTAVTIGKQFGVSDKTVTDAVRLYRAIEALTDTLGIDARKQLLSHNPPASRDTVIDLADAPEAQQRDAWQLLLKRDAAGVKAILAKVKRVEQQRRHPGLAGDDRAERHAAAMDLYPLPELVRRIAAKWPVDRLEGWRPSYAEGEVLELHAETALRSLIWIAEHYDWGQAALDDYLAEHAPEAEAEDAREDAQDAPEPEGQDGPPPEPAAAPGASQALQRAPWQAEQEALLEALADRGDEQEVMRQALEFGKPEPKHLDAMRRGHPVNYHHRNAIWKALGGKPAEFGGEA